MKISEISLSYNPKLKVADMPKISSSFDAEKYFRSVWSDKIQYIEECYLLLLNRAKKVIGFLKLSQGGTSGTVVDAKVIFQAALKCNANSMIIAHNHPSGNLNPSQEDIILTKKLITAGVALELPVLDHLILTEEGYTSLADQGLM